MNVIAVASTKGGVGKTTTAVSLAAALGREQSTLLLDFDPQGQVSLWFGHDPKSSVFDWWVDHRPLEYCTMPARESHYLWLMLGDSRSRAIEKLYRDLSTLQYDEFVGWIRGLREHFEYVVIDTAPGGVMQEVALGASDNIVVPFKAEAPGIDGAYGTLEMLRAIKHRADITLLAVDYYSSVVEQKRNLREFCEQVGEPLLAPQPVPHRIAVAEAVAEGKTIWEYDGRGIEEVRSAYCRLLHRIAPSYVDNRVVEEKGDCK